MSVITFDQVTPAWLTAILNRHGSLIAGQVSRLEQSRSASPMARNATLHIIYSQDTRVAYPTSLFFKQNREPAEIKFHQSIALSAIERLRADC